MTTIVPTNFAPFHPALGPQPASALLYHPTQVVLRMKEKVWSLSGDDFTVQTVDGADLMKVKGKLVSLHNKKKFVDMHDNELFTLSERKLKLNKTFIGEAPGAHNFEVKGHFSLGTSKSTVEFVNNSDRTTVELQVKGDWFDRAANITLGDRPVAQISRSFFNKREIVADKQTYFVTIAPNVDLSMIAAICVCLDERENEK